KIKQQEKANRPQPGSTRLLDDVPISMPGLTRAVKLQKKAATVGFDWPDPQAVIAKIEEELQEVREEVESGDKDRLEAEIGDLLFAVTNLARHYKINPDVALRGTNQRFSSRFSVVEDRMMEQGGWESATLEKMEAAWQEAKQREKLSDSK
ncbi:MAG: MazG nucleotide pyrophosphohydrolase domain-containing protein, partial [Oceanobacter sp.]